MPPPGAIPGTAQNGAEVANRGHVATTPILHRRPWRLMLCGCTVLYCYLLLFGLLVTIHPYGSVPKTPEYFRHPIVLYWYADAELPDRFIGYMFWPLEQLVFGPGYGERVRNENMRREAPFPHCGLRAYRAYTWMRDFLVLGGVLLLLWIRIAERRFTLWAGRRVGGKNDTNESAAVPTPKWAQRTRVLGYVSFGLAAAWVVTTVNVDRVGDYLWLGWPFSQIAFVAMCAAGILLNAILAILGPARRRPIGIVVVYLVFAYCLAEHWFIYP